MTRENTHWWYHAGQRPPQEIINEAVQLYNEGWTLEELGQKFHRTKPAIWRWINIFAEDLDNPDMKKKRIRTGERKAKVHRLTGIKAPETTAEVTPQSTSSCNEETPEQKIKRLEKELSEARLARDFYNEMINVAERQFNIDIRKKAGTRQ